MQPGTWISVLSQLTKSQCTRYYIQIESITEKGIRGRYTFRTCFLQLVPVLDGGLFPWESLKSIKVLNKKPRGVTCKA